MAPLKTIILFFTVLCCILINAENIIVLDKRIPQAVGGGGVGSSAASSAQQQSSSQASSQPAAQPSGNTTLPNTGNSTVSGGNSTVSGNSTNNPLGNLPTSASYGVTVQVGIATFLAPTASKSVSPLYRVDANENVTFSWSYTNLLVRPANLTLAAVGPQSVTYTIAALAGDATSYVWQLNSVVPKTPLMNGYYQIQLYDQRGPSAVPSPGWLMPQSRLTIAFYTPQSYQSINNSNYCPTCFYSAAQALKNTFGPMGIAFGIACLTSGLFIYGLIY
ncbi:uncharacterized protein BX664DRAFT_342780 [Halteromyces radiatus]|uniref:uncharacterized protein n=1 Tax=Halteromyces radiatus TaxID=101107 RepID=UPI002220936D|nr:uncharacterized protein BX664DRAFT_342780 [Halteromyces radiatus]KAI8078820.1 hypothetical protein BX664DRAFT_342780 [Halteromyces radiatus]